MGVVNGKTYKINYWNKSLIFWRKQIASSVTLLHYLKNTHFKGLTLLHYLKNTHFKGLTLLYYLKNTHFKELILLHYLKNTHFKGLTLLYYLKNTHFKELTLLYYLKNTHFKRRKANVFFYKESWFCTEHAQGSTYLFKALSWTFILSQLYVGWIGMKTCSPSNFPSL